MVELTLTSWAVPTSSEGAGKQVSAFMGALGW